MKVLIISPCILPVPAVKGGAVLTLIESLIAQNDIHGRMDLMVVGSYDKLANDVSKKYKKTKFIFLRHPAGCNNLDNAIEYVREKLTRKYSKRPHQYLWKMYVIKQINQLLITEDFDKVVFQNSGYLLSVLKNKKISKKYKGKLYYHLHNDIPDNVYLDGVRQCKLLLISEYLKKHITELCGTDIAQYSYIVKNGFDCNRFSQELQENERSELRLKLGILPEQKIVMFAGRIDPTKGINELVSAFSKLEQKDVILLVVGSHNFGTDQTSAFEGEMIGKFARLGDRVKFTGYVPYLDMWKYYSLADMAVLPSMWEEPAGLTMIEAAASGLPVITTNSGGIPEYMNPEWSVILDKSVAIEESIQNAIIEILENENTWREKKEIAQKYICTHNNEEVFYHSFVSAIGKEQVYDYT